MWQSRIKLGGNSLIGAIKFVVGSPMGANLEPIVDSTSKFEGARNLLGYEDWRGWHFAKAFGTIEMSDRSGIVLLRNQKGEPVIVTREYGKGRVTLVALNLDVQLLNIVPGAFRVLANLISY